MKKVVLTAIICLFVIGTIFLLWQDPRISNQIFISISELYDLISCGKQEMYNENFETNSLKCGNTTFYYDALKEEQKTIYTAIINGAVNLRKDILVKDYDYVDNEKLMLDISETIEALFADHPELFYIKNEYSVSTIEALTGTNVEINLLYDVDNKYELEKKIKNIEKEIERIISKVNVADKFDIELQIHDILAEDIEYYKYENIEDVPDYCHNIYGALIEKKAVCDGFAKLYQVLLSKHGISSIIVVGNLEGQAHAWNMVELGDSWYHLDLTSDISIKEQENVVIHSYFNVTTEEISETHTISKKDILPEAKSQEYNYYYIMNKSITDEKNFSSKFENIIQNNVNEKLLEIKVEGMNNVPNKMINTLKTYKYPEYLSRNDVKFNYYNVLNTYILLKK